MRSRAASRDWETHRRSFSLCWCATLESSFRPKTAQGSSGRGSLQECAKQNLSDRPPLAHATGNRSPAITPPVVCQTAWSMPFRRRADGHGGQCPEGLPSDRVPAERPAGAPSPLKTAYTHFACTLWSRRSKRVTAAGKRWPAVARGTLYRQLQRMEVRTGWEPLAALEAHRAPGDCSEPLAASRASQPRRAGMPVRVSLGKLKEWLRLTQLSFVLNPCGWLRPVLSWTTLGDSHRRTANRTAPCSALTKAAPGRSRMLT